MLLLLQGLRGHGLDSLLCAPRGSAVLAEAQRLDLPCRELSRAHDLSWALYREFAAVLRETRPHLAHLHSRRGADLLGGLAARRTGVPAVLSRRVDNPEPRWLARRKYALYPRVIAISEGIRQVLLGLGVPQGKLRLVRDGVDTALWGAPATRAQFAEEFGLPPDSTALGMVAQFIPRKGHRHLLQALPPLLDKHPGLQVLLFGTGPLQGEVHTYIEEREGLAGRVRLAGFRDDLPRWLGCLDLLAHPATAEGMGVALLQAASAGVPVVASRAGGIPEAVQDGVSGLLVPPADPAALGAALDSLLCDPELRKSMGAAGREFAGQQLSAERMVEGNLAVYREMLGRPDGQGGPNGPNGQEGKA